jgi:hypothetical protein
MTKRKNFVTVTVVNAVHDKNTLALIKTFKALGVASPIIYLSNDASRFVGADCCAISMFGEANKDTMNKFMCYLQQFASSSSTIEFEKKIRRGRAECNGMSLPFALIPIGLAHGYLMSTHIFKRKANEASERIRAEDAETLRIARRFVADMTLLLGDCTFDTYDSIKASVHQLFVDIPAPAQLPVVAAGPVKILGAGYIKRKMPVTDVEDAKRPCL